MSGLSRDSTHCVFGWGLTLVVGQCG